MDTLGAVAAATAVVAAGYGLWRWAREVYRRTLGRRRDLARRLHRLGANAQLDYFVSVLGFPPATRRQVGVPGLQAAELIFIDPLAYVQVIVFEPDNSVLAYAITTRTPRFHPLFEWLDVRLGKDRFPADHLPQSIEGFRGVRRVGYSEVHYLGNPGHYQHFVLAVNDCAPTADAPWQVLFPRLSDGDLSWGHDQTERALPAEVLSFRANSSPNTYIVIGPNLRVKDYPGSFGPDGDYVRTIP